jgi:hypothetical protein
MTLAEALRLNIEELGCRLSERYGTDGMWSAKITVDGRSGEARRARMESCLECRHVKYKGLYYDHETRTWAHVFLHTCVGERHVVAVDWNNVFRVKQLRVSARSTSGDSLTVLDFDIDP